MKHRLNLRLALIGAFCLVVICTVLGFWYIETQRQRIAPTNRSVNSNSATPSPKTASSTNPIAVIVSVCGFGVSLSALLISLYQKRLETVRGVRQQIVDLTTKLVAIDLEYNKLMNSTYIGKDYSEIDGFLVNQRAIYCRQLQFIDNNFSEVFVELEYDVIAKAFFYIGSHEIAESYHLKAIKNSRDRYSELMCRRGYANFLSFVTRIEESRSQFKFCIDICGDDTEICHFYNAMNYAMWSYMESESLNFDNSMWCLVEGKKEAEKIKASVSRDAQLYQISRAEQALEYWKNYNKEEHSDPYVPFRLEIDIEEDEHQDEEDFFHEEVEGENEPTNTKGTPTE